MLCLFKTIVVEFYFIIQKIFYWQKLHLKEILFIGKIKLINKNLLKKMVQKQLAFCQLGSNSSLVGTCQY